MPSTCAHDLFAADAARRFYLQSVLAGRACIVEKLLVPKALRGAAARRSY